jgi:hypothetical protein
MTTQPQSHSLDPRGNGRAPRELEEDSVEREPLMTPPPSAADESTREATSAPLPELASGQSTDCWQRIQSVFVDDPRKAVTEAHQQVTELMQRISDSLSKEQGEFDRRLSDGDSISTEDLRVRLQRYRNYFSQLSSSLTGIPGDAKV